MVDGDDGLFFVVLLACRCIFSVVWRVGLALGWIVGGNDGMVGLHGYLEFVFAFCDCRVEDLDGWCGEENGKKRGV